MNNAPAVAARLEAVFREIEMRRMQDVPILNLGLRVEAPVVRTWNDMWLCALVTPWFISLLLLPGSEELARNWTRLSVGQTVIHALPAGRFSFLVGEEEALGRFQSCSLFSPVCEFENQEAACAAAGAAVDAAMTPGQRKTAELADLPPKISRRALTGLRARTTQEGG